jgi:tetratricopeptide (TPR) repeat protein
LVTTTTEVDLAPARPQAVQTSSGSRVQLVTTTTEIDIEEALADPRTPAPQSTSRLSRPPAELVFQFPMPNTPPGTCVPNPALRAPSIEQADLGDEAMMARDYEAALGHWRAAVTINPCNDVAWANIGSLLLDGGAVAKADQALMTATRLQRGNVRAWTELGRSKEKQGQQDAAVTAYREALAVDPDYEPAALGLSRTLRKP